MRRDEVGDYVGGCAQLAALLEVSAYPKPGNVHRLRDFPSTRYEHFLAGSVAISTVIRELAMSGYDVGTGQKTWEEIGIGSKILAAVEASSKWQSGGNVNLGVILLFTPIYSGWVHIDRRSPRSRKTQGYSKDFTKINNAHRLDKPV